MSTLRQYPHYTIAYSELPKKKTRVQQLMKKRRQAALERKKVVITIYPPELPSTTAEMMRRLGYL
jgi:hypothetical protein